MQSQHDPPGATDPAAASPALGTAMRSKLSGRYGRALFASVVLIVVLGWLMKAGKLPLLPPKGLMQDLDVGYFIAFAVGLFVMQSIRFARCHFLIAPIAKLSFRKLMTINGIALALITFLPLRIGEVARPAMLREKGHLSAWAVTGTVGAERILDGVMFSVLLLLGLALAAPHEPLPTHIGALPVPASLIPKIARFAGLGFGCAFLIMATFYFYRDFARRLTERVVGIASKSWATKLADVVERISDGLRFLTNPRYSVPYIAVSCFATAMHVWATVMLARSVGIPELTYTQAMVVVGVLALGFGMPNAPGFFGTVQLSLYAGLAVYVAPAKIAHEGALLVFLFYITYLAEVVLLAVLALIFDKTEPEVRPA